MPGHGRHRPGTAPGMTMDGSTRGAAVRQRRSPRLSWQAYPRLTTCRQRVASNTMDCPQWQIAASSSCGQRASGLSAVMDALASRTSALASSVAATVAAGRTGPAWSAVVASVRARRCAAWEVVDPATSLPRLLPVPRLSGNRRRTGPSDTAWAGRIQRRPAAWLAGRAGGSAGRQRPVSSR